MWDSDWSLTNTLRSRMSPQISENEHVLQHASAGNVTRAISPGTDSCAKWFVQQQHVPNCQLHFEHASHMRQELHCCIRGLVSFCCWLNLVNFTSTPSESESLLFREQQIDSHRRFDVSRNKKQLATSDEQPP